MSEAPTLPTVPQPLPNTLSYHGNELVSCLSYKYLFIMQAPLDLYVPSILRPWVLTPATPSYFNTTIWQ